MTAIVGLVEDSTVYIGADSAGAKGWVTRGLAIPKAVAVDDMIIACAGDPRALQIIQYHAAFEKQIIADDLRYMVTVVAATIRNVLKEQGYADIENNSESIDSAFLVGYSGNLYVIDPNYQVIQYKRPFAAIGSGGEYAESVLIALHSQWLVDTDLSPHDKIRLAICVAADMQPGYVAEPIHILELS
ncbi:MAG: hypothetical protein GY943_16760 [Chloroflexi bacterium]|nr:hypothetical protein [Chloroflexota bacterium]